MTRAQIRIALLALLGAGAALLLRERALLERDARRAWLRSPQAAFLAFRRDRMLAAELGDCGCGR